MQIFKALILLVALSACAQTPPTRVPQRAPAQPAPARTAGEVIARIEPVAEATCREMAPQLECDFALVVLDRPRLPPNAFQTRVKGRPVIGFTPALLSSTRNPDELAFVLGHEAAHHILGHIERRERNAGLGALVLARMAGEAGASPAEIARARRVGAAVGARSYSKEFELEADRLGARIALRAGFDPIRGAQFFTRLPDPGDRFLGTHPPNAARIAAVRAEVGR